MTGAKLKQSDKWPVASSKQRPFSRILNRLSALKQFAGAFCILLPASGLLPSNLLSQMESIESPAPQFVWTSHGRIEAHLALNYSPAGAFSPDSSVLAAVSEDKIVLFDLRSASIRKVLRPRLEGITDLRVQSANFLTPDHLFLLADALFAIKGRSLQPRTPELAFQWDTQQDALFGKLDSVGSQGGFLPPRYFPEIGYLGLYKESVFQFWSPLSGRGGGVKIPDLTHPPHLYAISPDGHWILLAQIETSSTPDPVVVDRTQQKFVDSLAGHHGTVLGMSFSRDAKRVVTACEDGKVRIFSVPGWKLALTLSAHQGPVHWAEFSPDGKWVASAGEDMTVRVWSAESGKLLHTLAEAQAPVLTVAFSPDGEFLAASTENTVLMWKRNESSL